MLVGRRAKLGTDWSVVRNDENCVPKSAGSQAKNLIITVRSDQLSLTILTDQSVSYFPTRCKDTKLGKARLDNIT